VHILHNLQVELKTA